MRKRKRTIERKRKVEKERERASELQPFVMANYSLEGVTVLQVIVSKEHAGIRQLSLYASKKRTRKERGRGRKGGAGNGESREVYEFRECSPSFSDVRPPLCRAEQPH